jgi:hypothetical protein
MEEGSFKTLRKRFGHSGRNWRSSVKVEMNRDFVVRTGQWVARERPDVIFTCLFGDIENNGEKSLFYVRKDPSRI